MPQLSSVEYQDRQMCDACAHDLESLPHITALVWGMRVRVCHSQCLIDLQRIWTPTGRKMRWSVVVRYSLGILTLGMMFAI